MIWQSKLNDGATPNHPQYGSGGSPIIPSKLQGIDVGATVNPNGTDWMDAIFDPGLAQQYKVTVSSGSSDSKFLMSMEYLDIQGAQIMTGYKTGRTRMNGEFRVNDRITIGEHLNVSYDQENRGIKFKEHIDLVLLFLFWTIMVIMLVLIRLQRDLEI